MPAPHHLQQTVSSLAKAIDPVVAGLKPTEPQPLPLLTALYAVTEVFFTAELEHVVVREIDFWPPAVAQSTASKSVAVCAQLEAGVHVHELHARLSVALVPAVLCLGNVDGHDCAPAFAAHSAMPVGFGAHT